MARPHSVPAPATRHRPRTPLHTLLASIFLTGLPLSAALADTVGTGECRGEPMPAANLLCAAYLPQPLLADTGADVASQLQAAIDYASQLKRGIYLPAGRYLITQDIALKSDASLYGSPHGATVLAAPATLSARTLGDTGYYTYVNDVTLDHLIFDNVRVALHGRKMRDVIRYNAFINTNSRNSQLAFGAQPAQIIGNVFMRGRDYPGLGLDNLGNAPGLKIIGNFFGSPGEQELAQGYIDSTTDQLLTTLSNQVASGALSLSADQGNFVTAWTSTSNLRGATFARNFVSGNRLGALWNPVSGKADIGRDHGLYIKQYKDVEVLQNYFSGWPDDASGHLKFRNAEGLYFAGNYLDGINFMARPYDNSPVLLMKDTFVFNNHFRNAGMDYWQNFTDTPQKFIDTTRYLVFNNAFESASAAGCKITGTWRHTVGFLSAGGNYQVGQYAGLAVPGCDVREFPAAGLSAQLPAAKAALNELQPIIPRYQHAGGILRLGTGLSRGAPVDCLSDGRVDNSYGANCVTYRQVPGLGFVAERTFIDFAYAQPVVIKRLNPQGYWRQAKAGALGNWRLEGCSDLACNYRTVIAAEQPLHFGAQITPASDTAFRAFRLTFVGGNPTPNGGAGAAGFSELEAVYTPGR